MILSLPNELQRMIINRLPIKSLKNINQTVKEIKELKLTKMLTGWYLECLTGTEGEISYQRRRIYHEMDRKKGPIYCMYEMMEHLSKMNGDYTVWDTYDTLRHDYQHMLKRRIVLNDNIFDIGLNKSVEKRILKLQNISRYYYIREILSSKLLRALF